MKKLIDVIPQWRTNGIFNYLNEFNIPWDETLSLQLDLEYFGNLSGDKNISPLVDKILGNDSILTNGNIEVLASVVYSLHGDNWRKQWETTQLTYNPISNYDMSERMTNDTTTTQYGKTETRTNNLTHGKSGTETETPNTTETRTDNLTHGKSGTETETPNITETRTDNLTHGKSGTETETPNTTQTTTPNLTNGETDTIHGFNSSVGVTSNGRTITSTGTNTTTVTGTTQKSYNLTESDSGTQTLAKTGNTQKSYNLTDSDSGTQTLAKTGQNQTRYDITDIDTGTQTNANTGTDSTTRNYVLTRSGNIGVTTTQQMIEQERNLLLWNFFYMVVFPDLDRVLTIQIY